VATDGLLEAFLERLEPRIAALRSGGFDGVSWAGRQVTTGRPVRLVTATADDTVLALGVDVLTGALVVTGEGRTGERQVLVGEITHVRLAQPVGTGL
jgi:hypothetical protein